MPKTYAQQLEDIQTLIDQVQSSPNKSVTIAGRQFTKHDLGGADGLYEREKYLRRRAAREATGGRRVQRVIPF